uniref:Capsid protein n=1 Tax=Gyromitra esculenta partitivirus 1 TaxID=2813171 RepID=A0A894JV19_9VIRU|nr:capsid protein [Gyromitra esculenta partitivirus 1]
MSALTQFKSAVTSSGLEDQFLKVTGLTSLDELSPDNFSDMRTKAGTLVSTIGVPSAAAQSQPSADKHEADARPAAKYEEASDFLYGFKHLQIRFPPRRQPSTFFPNATVMYLILHQMNLVLSDHFYFLRSAPDFHPALLRVYFGILFIVQTLRAQHAANSLTGTGQYEFIKRFTDAYPAETLAIPAPLLQVFKALCASQPEIPQLGLVTPFLPSKLGPATLKDITPQSNATWFLPDITGILSLLYLQSTSKEYKKGFHPSFSTSADTTFRGATFDKDHSKWTDVQAWSLRYPGIEHPFETGKKVNDSFFEDRYEDLGLPSIGGTTANDTVECFTLLSGNISWFAKLRDIAGVAAKYFPGSGSLADCATIGLPIGQIQSHTVAPDTLPTKPTGFTQDSSFNMDLSFKLQTTARSIPQLAVIMAGASQVNVRIYKTHPAFGTRMSRQIGPFWDIRPVESSTTEDSIFYGMSDSIKKAIKDKA